MAISACILTYNEEHIIEKCLRSLDWADEIIIVDSFSSDSTFDICKKYADRLEQRQWPGFRDQYDYATSLASHDWIIFIDADEIVPPELADEINKETVKNNYDGFLIYRQTYYLGRWIKHGGWNPDGKIRVYKKGKGEWEGGLHATVKVDGKVGKLKNIIHHYNYKDISDQIRTIDRYSANAADEMLKKGKSFGIHQLILRPLFRFFRDYFLKRGYKDGLPGFIIAVATGFYVFIKFAKLWELTHIENKRDDSKENHRKF